MAVAYPRYSTLAGPADEAAKMMGVPVVPAEFDKIIAAIRAKAARQRGGLDAG